MRATLGVNDKIQGISLDPFLAFNARAKPEVNVSIDEPKSAAAQLAQGTRVIYRWSGDDHAHERYAPKWFVQKLHEEAPPGCVLHLGNEPGTGSLELLDSWTVAALDECERLGRKGAIYSFATGEPEPGHWPRLRRSMLKAKRGDHLVDEHEYFDVTVARSLKWHIGRHEFIYQTFGADTPQIVIGELGCAVGYNPYAGWQSHLTAEEYGVELAQAQAVYKRRGIPACIYLWGPWDKTTTFDIRGELGLQDTIVRLNKAMTGVIEPPKPGTPGIDAVLAALPATYTYRNLRTGPELDAPVVGAVTLREPVTYYPADTRNGWYFVVSRQTPDERGWMLGAGATMQHVTPPAEQGVTLTRAEYDQMMSILTSAAKRQGGNS